MDYETDQLNKYDMADAQRYLMGAVKKPDPEFELFVQEISKEVKESRY